MEIVLLAFLGILASWSPAAAAVPGQLSALPPSQFPQFQEILSKAVLRGPTSSHIRGDLNGFKEWYFGAFQYPVASSRAAIRLKASSQAVIQFAAIGQTMSILQQANKPPSGGEGFVSDELYKPDWVVSDHNGAIAEFFIPEPESGVRKFTVLSFALDVDRSARVGPDSVLMRFEWTRDYEGHHDVLLLHFRRIAGVGGAETFVIGERPTEDSPLKVRCEVDHNRAFVEAGDRTIIDGTELEGYDEAVFWIRAGVVVYDAEPEAIARVQFTSLEWIEEH